MVTLGLERRYELCMRSKVWIGWKSCLLLSLTTRDSNIAGVCEFVFNYQSSAREVIALGFGEGRGGVEDGLSNCFSLRSESWNLGELDITSPDLRSVCLVPGLKSMLRMCGGEASPRSTELACLQQWDDKSVTRSRVWERC